jgi:uncharacterized protein YcnI
VQKKLTLSAIALATTLALSATTAASAHVSVLPGVTATGSTTAALTAGQSGTLYFRVGHGCTDETGIKNPTTGVSMAGTSWPTAVFSVHIPVEATGTGSTVPKPQYIPGWKNRVTKNTTDGSYDVTWSAVSADFYLPDAPEGDGGGKMFMDFGVAIKWKAGTTGSDVWFAATQSCVVDMTNKPAFKSPAAVAVSKVKSKSVLTLAGLKKNAFKIVDVKVNGEVLRSQVALSKTGALNLTLTSAELARVKAKGALVTVVKGADILGYTGGAVASRNIFVKWDVTDGSGKDTVLDDTEHNSAPKVTVL